MLEEIRISGLGIIESSTLELGPGLTVVTGETGAGKTMIVTALGLLLGGRGDAGSVRTGKKSARVEGVIDARTLPGVVDATEEAGGEVEEGRVLVARTVAAEGRARAYVGGATVPVATLGSVTSPLVAVHGQSDQHRLLQPRAQRDSLDRFGGDAVAKLLAAYTDLHAELGKVERELDDVTTHARERAQEADLLRFGLGEIEAVSPEPGEDATLAQEEGRLGYADTLRTAAEQAREALSTEDPDAPDALGAVSAARRALDSVRDHDPDAAALAERLAEVNYLLSDAATDVASYAAAVETDPARLAVVSERRAALTALTRKYGETIDEVLAWSETSAKRLLELDSDDSRIEELKAERTRLRAELADAGVALSTARTDAAGALAEAVSDELTGLAMPHARLVVDVRQKETDAPGSEDEPHAPLLVGSGKSKRWLRYGSNGLDEVELLLAANTGSEPRPLHKGASGGELSRVMLAIEVVLAATSPVPTFVFDEVDAGVGGTAAVEIGRRLAQLARTAQVLVVTHLPQVAAFADHHVAVEKTSDGVVTSSGLSVLDDDSRERELSRMLAGLTASDTAIAHARELLDVARSAKP
ncbi:DNA replication and repair protein RecN [Nocardioides albertanoniae]|uniref:DNA repair protein RecN n=1 Tax=Nocardioides albertanoniae TaxID=1175486 RepID=A0A543A810_9ACTN|nr:DNA repair protein RecN [Nocardioides albertanoniae]TQL68735.1 DNA replication and repair protein RecN [Nocardioides albertanoniae]